MSRKMFSFVCITCGSVSLKKSLRFLALDPHFASTLGRMTEMSCRCFSLCAAVSRFLFVPVSGRDTLEYSEGE